MPRTKKSSDLGSSLPATIGFDIIGPVVHRWMLALDQYIGYFDDENTVFLYCTRAGLRIQELYRVYLEGLGRRIQGNHQILWASRIAVCKGTFSRQRDRSSTVIAREYWNNPLRELTLGVLCNCPEILERLSLDGRDLDAHGFNFPGWIQSNNEAAVALRDYLERSSVAFDLMMSELTQSRSRVVLIDSGWQGTMQSLLTHAYPEREFFGLYLGRILGGSHDESISDRVIGLLFQAEKYRPDNPETAITLHRHLFESMLEPNTGSVEEIIGGPASHTADRQIQQLLEDTPSQDKDVLYLSALEYLRSNTGLMPAAIVSRHQAAIGELGRMLARPTGAEALALAGKDRSADFGRTLKVPVLLPVDGKLDPDDRVQKSLWPQGQVALEFDGGMARSLQDRITGLSDNASYFDPAPATADQENKYQPLVAVITRTKNRPLLLKRAEQSIARQTWSNFIWVIVNDGGDADAVRQVIEASNIDPRRIQLVSNEHSLGMEAASNLGIRSVDSEYILVHDDDDTLHPEFLERTIKFLESSPGSRYGGVITHAEYVSEEIRGNKVIEHSRTPYVDWVRNIQISELLAENIFAPISFLYRRSIYDSVGGYNENLPVLGDWFFNLEFVLKADIKVIPEILSYYHHRDRGDSSRLGVYANSVIGGQSKHEEFAAIARNEFLRRHGSNNPIAASAVLGYFAADLRGRLNRVSQISEMAAQRANTVNIPAADKQTKTSTSYDWTEVDRLWLLLQATQLHSSGRGWWASKGKPPSLDLTMSLEDVCKWLCEQGVAIAAHPSFDELSYLRENPDVREAVQSGEVSSGYAHYLMNGRFEARSPIRRRR